MSPTIRKTVQLAVFIGIAGTGIALFLWRRDQTIRHNKQEEAERQVQRRLLLESTSKALAVESVKLVGQPDSSELAALLARQAALFYARAPGENRDRVDEALYNLGWASDYSQVVHTEGFINSVALSPDGALLGFTATSGGSKAGGPLGSVWIYDLQQQGAKNNPRELRPENYFAKASAVFSPNGVWLAWGGSSPPLEVWSLKDDVPAHLLEAHVDAALNQFGGYTSRIAFSPNSQKLAVTRAKAICVLNLAEWGLNSVVLTGHPGNDLDLAFSPDSQQLASAGEDGVVRVWDLRQPKTPIVKLAGHDPRSTSVMFTWREKELVTSGWGPIIKIWDLGKNGQLQSALNNQSEVNALALSPSGRLAAGCADGFVRLWDLKRQDASPIVIRGSRTPVNTLALSDNGDKLAAGSGNTVRIWESPRITADSVCSHVRRNLTIDEWRRFVGKGLPYERTCQNITQTNTSLP